MQYLWWSEEDYRENDFELLTPKDVNEHFLGNIRLFNHIEETCDNYNDPEILEEYVGYSLEDFNKAEIDKLINE